MAKAAMNMVSQVGFGGKLSFKKMSAWGRLCYNHGQHATYTRPLA